MIIGEPSLVSFKLDITGSSDAPKVRVVLCSVPELTFYATKVPDGWQAEVTVPPTVSPGRYDLKIEVILNGRIFVPVTKQIEVMPAETEVKPAVAPLVDIGQESQVPSEEPSIEPPVIETTQQVPEKKQVTVPPDLFKNIFKTTAAESTTPKKIAALLSARIERQIAKTEKKPEEAPKRVIELRQEIPVELIKEDIVFE